MSAGAESRLQRLGERLRGREVKRWNLPAALLRPSAVLVPLSIREGELWVSLTKRRDDLRRHAGQMSFPGGRTEEGDPDAFATALREAKEEVGLAPEHVELVGPLDEIPTFTGYRITPFVGRIPWPYPLVGQPDEVAEIVEVSFATLRRADVHSTSAVKLPVPLPIPLPLAGLERFTVAHTFQVGPHRIWGATAHLLAQLLELDEG